MVWPYPYFEKQSLTLEQQALLTQLQTLQSQVGEETFGFVLAAMLAQQGEQRIHQEADEIQIYVGCILCAVQVEHSSGECPYWGLSGKSSCGFNSDDVSGRALLFKKGDRQWLELHYAYLQDGQVELLSRLQLTYPVAVHITVDRVTYPGVYVRVALYKDEQHWVEWRNEVAEKEAVWQEHRARQHQARLRCLETTATHSMDEPTTPYELPNPAVHILRDQG